MSERLQIILLLCLTTMGILAVIGMIVLEAEGRPILGHLPSIATGCLVGLISLVTVMGQNARTMRVESKLDQIHESTNGGLAALQHRLEAALLTIQTLQDDRVGREQTADRLAIQQSQERRNNPPAVDTLHSIQQGKE